MTLFVHITDACQKDAKKYSYQKEINKFAERLRREQRTTLFDNFPPPFLKKRFERQIRLLAAERFFDEHVVVVFYRILIRGGRDYGQFLEGPTEYGKEHFLPLASDNELRTWLAKQLQESPPPLLPRPDDVESSYLWRVLEHSAGKPDGGIVCESPHWVEWIQDKSLKDAQRMEVQISDYFARTPTIPRATKLLSDVVARSETNGHGRALLSEPGIRASIGEVIDSVCERIPSDDFDAEWRSILDYVQRLQEWGVTTASDNLGRLNYQIGDYQKALTLWNEEESTGHALYRKAKARHVLTQLQGGVAVSLSSDEHRSVAEYFKEVNDIERALVHYRAGGDTAGIRSLCTIIPEAEKRDLGPRVATAFLEASVVNGEWPPVLDYCANEASAKSLSEFLASAADKVNLWMLRAGVVRAFSESDLLVRADNRKVKMPASDFLKRVLISEGFGWVDNIHVSVAGGALERAGRIVDCLQYYENVQSNPGISSDDVRFAGTRWVKCKQRQADHEKEHGKAKTAEKVRAEVDRRAKELSLDIRTLEEFPKPKLDAVKKRRSTAAAPAPESTKLELPHLSVVTAIPTQNQSEVTASLPLLSSVVGDYKFDYDRISGKLNFMKGLDTVALRLQKRSCTSADVDITENGLQFIAKEWQLEIGLGQLDTQRCFDVRLVKVGVSLRFAVDVSA